MLGIPLEVGLISPELVAVGTSLEEEVISREPAVVEILLVEVERPLVRAEEVISLVAEVMPPALVGEVISLVVVARPLVPAEVAILLEVVVSSLALVVGETSQVVVVKQQEPVEKESSQVAVMPLVPAEETTSPVPEVGRIQVEAAPEAVAPWPTLTLEAVEHLALPGATSPAVTSLAQEALVHNRPPVVTSGSASALVQAPAMALEAVVATHPAV